MESSWDQHGDQNRPRGTRRLQTSWPGLLPGYLWNRSFSKIPFEALLATNFLDFGQRLVHFQLVLAGFLVSSVIDVSIVSGRFVHSFCGLQSDSVSEKRATEALAY